MVEEYFYFAAKYLTYLPKQLVARAQTPQAQNQALMETILRYGKRKKMCMCVYTCVCKYM